MKIRFLIIWIIILLAPGKFCPAHAQDMRVMQLKAQEKRATLLQKAREEKERAIREAREARKRILADKSSLMKAINRLKRENKRLTGENNKLEDIVKTLEAREKALISQRREAQEEVRELVGQIRTNAKDLQELLDNSLQSAFLADRGHGLQAIVNRLEFPGMDEVRTMAELLFQEISFSG